MPPIVSILVVSYNTREMTLDCLRSVQAQTRVPYELIVVDNASSDGSAESISAEFPDVELIAATENYGFAKASNIAAAHARGEYILLLNPDTVVLDGAIDELVAFARAKPQAKIWGGRTIFEDGTLNSTCCFQHMTLWKVFCRTTGLNTLFGNHWLISEAYGGWDMNDVRPVDITTGCFLLIRRRLWEDLDGFNLTYFMYGEDADLCLRARDKFGANPHFTPDAQIVHHGGASEPVRADKMVRLFNAKMTIIQHHFRPWERPIAQFLFRMVPLSRYLMTSCLASVTRREGSLEAAKVWAEIWTRRGEWECGHH